MTQEQIIKEYNRLVSEIESTRMYDGRGEYNGYTCDKCGFITVTLYKAKGVTPFILKCPKCGGTSVHNITSRNPPPYISELYSEVKNWVRPTIKQLLKMHPATIEHVLNGGLVFEEELKGGSGGNR